MPTPKNNAQQAKSPPITTGSQRARRNDNPLTQSDATEHLTAVNFITTEEQLSTLREVINSMERYVNSAASSALILGVESRKTIKSIAIILDRIATEQEQKEQLMQKDKPQEDMTITIQKAVADATADMKLLIEQEVSKVLAATQQATETTIAKVDETAAVTKAHLEKASTEWNRTPQAPPPSQQGKPTPPTPSWAEIVSGKELPNNANYKVAAHAAIIARQVKFTLQGDTGLLRIEQDNKEMKTKIQNYIKVEGLTHGIHALERSIKTRSVLIEMSTTEGAQWLKEAVRTEKLTKAWGVKYIPRTYSLLIKFVPVSCEIEEERAEILEANGIDKDHITEFRWFKPKTQHRTDPPQKVANVLIVTTNETTANTLVSKGIRIHAARRPVEKQRYEPLRCNKCQLYVNHMASKCKAKDECCSYCMGKHRSKECPGSQVKRCKPCGGMSGHAASDRECPSYQREIKKHNIRNPANKSPYFPTIEPFTWIIPSNIQPKHKSQRERKNAQREDEDWEKELEALAQEAEKHKTETAQEHEEPAQWLTAMEHSWADDPLNTPYEPPQWAQKTHGKEK